MGKSEKGPGSPAAATAEVRLGEAPGGQAGRAAVRWASGLGGPAVLVVLVAAARRAMGLGDAAVWVALVAVATLERPLEQMVALQAA